MDTPEQSLFFFRKLLFLLYLEIGALQPRNHPEIAAKAKLSTAFFQREKERQAAELYHETEQETDPEKILAPYVERTGLSLVDVQRAFREGDWHNKFGGTNFGGPKWAQVAEMTLDLYHAIQAAHWDQADALIYAIKTFKTSQGYLINQFERTERRR